MGSSVLLETRVTPAEKLNAVQYCVPMRSAAPKSLIVGRGPKAISTCGMIALSMRIQSKRTPLRLNRRGGRLCMKVSRNHAASGSDRRNLCPRMLALRSIQWQRFSGSRNDVTNFSMSRLYLLKKSLCCHSVAFPGDHRGMKFASLTSQASGTLKNRKSSSSSASSNPVNLNIKFLENCCKLMSMERSYCPPRILTVEVRVQCTKLAFKFAHHPSKDVQGYN
mmetsp:Transcript_5780/g.14136  ORF Transcript_5780/g.14136 Transcript_5780/m.14136 type:complete len:222 (-) Transcript_5780:153-818(-)